MLATAAAPRTGTDRLLDTAAVALLVSLCALPWILPGLAASLGGHRVHELARGWQVALAGACAIAATVHLLTRARTRLPRAFWIVAIAGLASIAASAQPVWALREAALWAGLIGIAIVAARGLTMTAWTWCVAAATTVFALLALLLAATSTVQGITMDPEDFFLGYANHRFYNHVQTVAVPWCALIALTAERRPLRLLAGTGVVLSLALLALSGGRATALALAVGLLGTRLWLGRPADRLWRPVAGAALAGLLVWALLFVVLPQALGVAAAPNTDHQLARLTSDQSRLALWSQALQAWAAHPLLGVGPMHLAHQFNGTAAHPHQIPLQILAEWGLVVTAAVAWLAWRAGRGLLDEARAATRGRATPKGLVGAGLLWMWIAVAVDACLSGNLVMPVSQLWIACAAGWTWRWVQGGRSRRHETLPAASGWMARWAFGLVVLSLPLGLAVDVARQWPTLEQQITEASQRFPAWRLQPRFWTHGWF